VSGGVDVAVRLRDHLHGQVPRMEALLTYLVRAESPSVDAAAQQEVMKRLGQVCTDLGFDVRHWPGRQTGGVLVAAPRKRQRGRPRQLLLGHCDTVWPLGTLVDMPVEQREGKLYGPGVYDMKAGLVQALFALEALRDVGIQPAATPVLVINSDEEIGSPESTHLIVRLAKIAERAFVMEPSLGPTGQLKTARKGVGRFTIRVLGRSAHAGLDPDKGRSAILELSHVVQTLFQWNDPQRGVTINVGRIDGGSRPNVVAAQAVAEVDVRVLTQEDAQRIEAAILGLQATTPDTSLQVQGRFGRPPMERTPENRRLWDAAHQVADSLGLPLEQGTAGGGSDGNTTSQWIPTLDGLGAVGDGAHAQHEHVEIEQMPLRAALLAGLLVWPLFGLSDRSDRSDGSVGSLGSDVEGSDG